MKTILIPISEGFEEIETATIIDVLRRASLNVVVAGLQKGEIKGRSDIKWIPDCTLDEALEKNSFDAVVLPGGQPNAYNLRDDQRIIEILKKTHLKGGLVSAICAAPAALEKAGLLKGLMATNFPALKDDLASAKYCSDRVVISGRIITSRGPATAMEFSLSLVLALTDEATCTQLKKDLLVCCCS